MHEEWTDKLSEFLDGELPADEQRAVDAHLRACAACAAVLADLKRVVARAQQAGAVPRPPTADLWVGIAARIDNASPSARADRPAEGFARRRASATAEAFALRTRRIAFTLPQLAAAAALVAAVSGGVVWTFAGRSEGLRYEAAAEHRSDAQADSGSVAQPFRAAPLDRLPADTMDRVVPVGMADAQYDAAVADLEGALKQGRGRLDAATIAVVEHNLQIIDQAIAQAREALAGDPANTYLTGHLVEARRRKLDLLRRAAALTSESD
ncbi:MAG: zf-HC2 domain-containing protein [Acidobacteria bacterium]|nr:zf-HC2 domain-containing protein [Acidobacteriota bacterium]